MGQVFLSVLQFSCARIIPSMLHIHSLIYHECFIILATDSAIK